MSAIQDAGPKKILIVRLGAMGDITHALPAVAALRKRLPKAEIGWLVERRWAGLLTTSLEAQRGPAQPIVDRVHVVETKAWRKSWLRPSTMRAFSSSVNEVRRCRYDVAIDFQGAIKSAVFTQLSGTRRRFGFADPWETGAGLFYNRKIRTTSEHVVEQNFDLADGFAKAYGLNELKRDVRAALPVEGGIEAEAISLAGPLDVRRPFVILNPGAGWGAKQWPAERYAKVARLLGDEGYQSLVSFGPGEEELAQIVVDQGGGHAHKATLSVLELTAIARLARLFIGGDTGPTHLAALLKLPVVAIFGPTDPARNGPYDTTSVVLRDESSVTSHKRVRETDPGLLNITTEQVLDAARGLLSKNGKGARA